MSQLLSKLARRILPTQPPPPPLNAKKFVGTEFKAPCTGSLGRAIAKQFFFASHHDALREIVRKQVVLVKQSNGSLLRVHTLKHPVREGQLIQLPQMILKPAPSKSHSDTGISIRYEDANLLIIDKPAGLAMHGGRSIDRAGDTLLPWLARHCPGAKPLHRLDRDATGLVLFAKNADMATRLLHLDPLIDESRIEKTYWTVCIGIPEERRHTVTSMMYEAAEQPMTSLASKRARLDDPGKPAVSQYHVASEHLLRSRQQALALSLIHWTPRTGRKHQLRVHAAEQLQRPVLGDVKYAKQANWQLAECIARHAKFSPQSVREMVTRLHLHCARIVIKDYQQQLPSEGEGEGRGVDLVVESPMPPHWCRTLEMVPVWWQGPPPRPRASKRLLFAKRYGPRRLPRVLPRRS